jgi:hypothetical protein
MNCNVKAPRIFFVTGHFYVLQKSNEFCDSPAELSRIRFNENQLKNVNDQEASILCAILHDHGARDQVTIVCEDERIFRVCDESKQRKLTQVEGILDLNTLRGVGKRQQLLHLAVYTLAHFSDQEEESNRPSSFFHFSARKSPTEFDACQRRSRRRKKNRRIHTQKLYVEVCLHHLIVLVLKQIQKNVFGLVEVLENCH